MLVCVLETLALTCISQEDAHPGEPAQYLHIQPTLIKVRELERTTNLESFSILEARNKTVNISIRCRFNVGSLEANTAARFDSQPDTGARVRTDPSLGRKACRSHSLATSSSFIYLYNTQKWSAFF